MGSLEFWLAVLCLVLGGLPLLVYPFVLLADVMSLAAQRSGKDPLLLTILSRSFQLGSLIYPLVYLPCLAAAIFRLKAHNQRGAVVISAIPVILLILLAILFFAWMACDRDRAQRDRESGGDN
jgi:hypothetical protein